MGRKNETWHQSWSLSVARAALRLETIGYTFKGNGTQSNARDNDPTTRDVSGARDSYFGGMVTAGYLY